MLTSIIYHADCFDGIAGAWVCRRYTNQTKNLDIFPIPMTYDQREYFNLERVRDHHVLIVDFSFPALMLREMSRVAEEVILMDHHKTAKEDIESMGSIWEYPKNVKIYLDMNRSGAGLAWDVLFPKEVRPWLIDTIEDRDLWKFKIPGTREVIAYLASQPLTEATFAETLSRGKGSIVDRGAAVLNYINNFSEKICATHTMRLVAGYRVPTINTPYMNISDHLDLLSINVPGYPFYVAYFNNRDRWQFSLRSKGDFDVSEVAKLFGGGGHKNASGFTVDFLPWTTMNLVNGNN